jgi:NAD-dependent dihydropyrimidine dehydrogenase PreA subunit
MMSDEKDAKDIDIFQLLETASKQQHRYERREILADLEVQDLFCEGTIIINIQTCHGVECKLCIDVCPTHALYWVKGEVGIEHTLCIYCMACVFSCIVEDCILITRKRSTGEEESFSNIKCARVLLHEISLNKRIERIRSIYPPEPHTADTEIGRENG